jgi:hypothetical protein
MSEVKDRTPHFCFQAVSLVALTSPALTCLGVNKLGVATTSHWQFSTLDRARLLVLRSIITQIASNFGTALSQRNITPTDFDDMSFDNSYATTNPITGSIDCEPLADNLRALLKEFEDFREVSKEFRKPSNQHTAAVKTFQAILCRRTASVEKGLASYRVQVEASRRSGGHPNDKLKLEEIWHQYDLSIILINRCVYLLCLCFASPLWWAISFACSYFGAYHIQVQWALVGLVIGGNKSVLAEVIAAIRDFAVAPLATMKYLYDNELALFRLSTLLSDRTFELQDAHFGRVVASFLPVSSWAAVVVQAVSFYLGGVGIVGKCVAFFCCFKVLSEVAHRLVAYRLHHDCH